jgi:isopenicillin-N epimerase
VTAQTRRWREQMWMDPTITYLNSGSYGLLPKAVFDCVTRLREELYRNPVDFLWRQFGCRLAAARSQLAAFVGADPQRLFFTLNVSEAINLVAASLQLTGPGEIVLTDHEYGAMRWVWERVAAQAGLTLRTITSPVTAVSPATAAEVVITQLGPATKLLFFSHVLHTTGMVLPAQAICMAARRLGVITVVDGAHAPGMIPLDLNRIGADFYCANLHKWLLAPLGAGFLYCSPGRAELLKPLQVSWGWHYAHDRADLLDGQGGTFRQRSIEFQGSRDLTPWLAVPEAIRCHQAIGTDQVRQHHLDLSNLVRQQVELSTGLKCVSPTTDELRGGLTAFLLPDSVDAEELRRLLWEQHRIEINVVPHPNGNLLRVSTHYFNLDEEVERLGRALPECLIAADSRRHSTA